eukprot:64-Rhodomonas_salina.2
MSGITAVRFPNVSLRGLGLLRYQTHDSCWQRTWNGTIASESSMKSPQRSRTFLSTGCVYNANKVTSCKQSRSQVQVRGRNTYSAVHGERKRSLQTTGAGDIVKLERSEPTRRNRGCLPTTDGCTCPCSTTSHLKPVSCIERDSTQTTNATSPAGKDGRWDMKRRDLRHYGEEKDETVHAASFREQEADQDALLSGKVFDLLKPIRGYPDTGDDSSI